jgi:glycosyltransferase involved in cell wall biosynthesis
VTLPAGTPVVVFGDDWGRNVSTMQHVFRWIIPHYPVVWVNGIGHRKPHLGVSDIRRAFHKARAMFGGPLTSPLVGGAGYQDPTLVLQPRVFPWHDNRLVYAYNVRTMLDAIRGALARIGRGAPPLVVTGSPPSVGVLGRLGESGAVYFCMDDFLHLPSASPEMIGPLEQDLLARVDAVVCTAESLTKTKVPRTGRVHYLPQGVNYDHFAAPRPAPAELAGLPRPLIGFAGGVSPCCDLALVHSLAAANPGGSVVLIGPVSVPVAQLDGANIHVLGARPYVDLPAYVQAFDVGIIPYVLNEWTRAVDPLKLLEYLAAGIPVVTTALPEAYKYRDVVAMAEDNAAFVEATARALATQDAGARLRRQAVARANTWERRAAEFMGILEEVATARGARAVPAL